MDQARASSKNRQAMTMQSERGLQAAETCARFGAGEFPDALVLLTK